MTNEEWVKMFMSEQWITLENCEIDFSKYEPISSSNSLHVYQDKYYINGETYSLSYAW